MIEKGRIFQGVTIFRKGVGYFLKLLQTLKDTDALKNINNYLMGKTQNVPILSREAMIYGLRVFTDIRRPKAFIRRDRTMGKTVKIIMEIVKYNSVPSAQTTSEKETGIDDLAAAVVDIMADAGYTYTPDYIFDRLDLPTIWQLKRLAANREARKYTMAIKIQHDPKGAIESINKIIGNQEFKTWADYKDKSKWQKK